jgi:hypothetical protein
MSKQALATLERERFAPSTSAALDERRRPDSEDGRAYPSKPEPRRSAALRWFVDTLALAGAGMAGAYVGVWPDPSGISGNQTSTMTGTTEDLHESLAAEPTSAKEQVPVEIASGMLETRSTNENGHPIATAQDICTVQIHALSS